MNSIQHLTGVAIAGLVAVCQGGAVPCAAAELSGRVVVGGAPVADSTVTLWEAGESAPQKLAETRSGRDGAFAFANSGEATFATSWRAAGVWLAAAARSPFWLCSATKRRTVSR
jgi:hypothetical protein